MKHKHHAIYIDAGPFKYGQVTHAGRMMCAECKTFIQWVSYEDVNDYELYQIKMQSRPYDGTEQPLTYESFYSDDGSDWAKISKIESRRRFMEEELAEQLNPTNRIWLMVKYQDKDTAKKLGAYWDHRAKCWYTSVNDDRALNLIDYMTEDDLHRLAKYYELI